MSSRSVVRLEEAAKTKKLILGARNALEFDSDAGYFPISNHGLLRKFHTNSNPIGVVES